MDKRCGKFIGILVTIALFSGMLSGCMQENTKAVTNEKGSDPVAVAKPENIKQENIMNIIKELTSEQYGGRLVGTKPNRMAAQYISDYFKMIGLENPKGLIDYLQAYVQPSIVLSDRPVLQIIDKNGKVLNDFDYPENFVLRRLSRGTNNIDMKAAMYLIKDPGMLSITNEELVGKVILLPWEFYDLLGSQNDPADFAEMFGASAVISEINLSDNKLGYSYLKVRPLSGSWIAEENSKPFAFVDSNTFSKLKDAAKTGSKLHFSCNSKVNVNNIVTNVVGLLPGSDPEFKDDCIIIGAHFDHVGANMVGNYNPGALDNASGTAVMMELARVIKDGKTPPKRSILFIAFNGEESGLNGARYYCENPIVPLSKSVMLNLDMVGSAAQIPLTLAIATDKSDTKLRDDLAVYADLLDIAYEKDINAASDHTPFSSKGVTSVLLGNLDLKSGYHSPHDNIDNISGDRLKEIAGLVLYYVNEKAY